jgi:hypothetical protein
MFCIAIIDDGRLNVFAILFWKYRGDKPYCETNNTNKAECKWIVTKYGNCYIRFIYAGNAGFVHAKHNQNQID